MEIWWKSGGNIHKIPISKNEQKKQRMALAYMVKPFSLVLETGIEPVRLYGTRDFKRGTGEFI